MDSDKEESVDGSLPPDTTNEEQDVVNESTVIAEAQAHLNERLQVEESMKQAYQNLEELFQHGSLTGTKVSQLKAKFKDLTETLNRSKTSEQTLIRRATDLANELDSQHAELKTADDFPENAVGEVSRLRTQLLDYRNKYQQFVDREYELNYKLDNLNEEKQIMDREYARLPKQGEVEKRIDDLKSSNNEMAKEIAQRQQEVRVLKEDLDMRKRHITTAKKEATSVLEDVEEQKGVLVSVNTQPTQIAKEADKLNRHKIELEKKLRQVNDDHRQLIVSLSEIKNKMGDVDNEKYDLDQQVDSRSSSLQLRDQEYQTLLKDYEYAKEREAVLMGDRATLDLNLRHITLEKKNCHDVHARISREKDKDLRNLKKMELHLKVAEDNKMLVRQEFDKKKANEEAMPKGNGAMWQKRSELTKEVENHKRSLAQQNSLTAVETVKVEQSIAEEERLLYEQSDLRIEVVELTRLAAIKNDEREQKARDFMKAEQRFTRAAQDLKSKRLQIQDHNKKFQEMQVKLRDFAKTYDIIKNERNKCVNLIQTSTQKAAEMREKIKILQNEIEILRTSVHQKDKLLQKQKLRHLNSIVVRDSLRNEVTKQLRIEDDMREKREQQRLDIAKLNLLINQSEETMQQQRKRYESAVQHRNDRGIQLIERNEEVCIFYEKVNIQDQMIRNGDVELLAREEELRFLKMQLTEEKRALDVLRKQTPDKKHLDNEIVTLQIQLVQCQDLMQELENKLEDPLDESRIRHLEGKDLTPAELQSKLEALELRLAHKEEQMLEKELIFEQSSRLAARLQTKANAGKEDTLELAKKVNEFQAKIKDVTRKMMAVVSELSMHQATALKLQQEVTEKERELEQCYMRMEKGEPPSDEMEREWLRKLRDEVRRTRDKDIARSAIEEEEHHTLPGGLTTTAEPRPNAYIPDDDSELPIPRPYGSHAPFKPTEPGSTMRHTRKPEPKPIEI